MDEVMSHVAMNLERCRRWACVFVAAKPQAGEQPPRRRLARLRAGPRCDVAVNHFYHVGRTADDPAGLRDALRPGVVAVCVIEFCYREFAAMQRVHPCGSLLQQIHEDEQGAVSLETILIVGAIALPILIFLIKVGWPRVEAVFQSGPGRPGSRNAATRSVDRAWGSCSPC